MRTGNGDVTSRVQPLEDRTSWSAIGACPVEHAMDVVGSRAAMLILREAFYGTQRFDDFVQRVGITPATAASRLKALTEVGIFVRRRYRHDGARAREEYVLSAAGEALMPVLVGLTQLSLEHLGMPKGIDLIHKGCGHELVATVVCPAHPDAVINSQELDARWTADTQRDRPADHPHQSASAPPATGITTAEAQT